MILRDYQSSCVDAVMAGFCNGHKKAIITLPTGAGKTVVFSHVIERMRERGRCLVLAHREELIHQAAQKIKAVTGIKPDIEMGTSWAMENSRFIEKSPIVVSSIQTQAREKRRHRFRPDEFALVVVDEAHHAPADSYKKVLNYYGSNPDCCLLGVTATPDRADKLALGIVFSHVAFTYEIEQAITDGWLVPIQQQYVVCSDLDFSNIKTTAGDLNGGELAQLMEREKSLHAMVSPTIDIIGERRTLFFCVSVIQAEHTCEIFNRYRPDMARCVFGHTPTEDRRDILADYANGRFQVLVNVGIATEGFDCPGIEVVAVGRPTKSRALYCQMIGRGTRPLAGICEGNPDPDGRRADIASSAKPNLLVIDFAGNSGRHKLITALDILGGRYPEEVHNWVVKHRKKSGGAFDVEEELAKAQKKIKEDEEKREALRRSKVKAHAEYRARDVDPFGNHDRFAGQETPRHWYIRDASDKQKALLAKFGYVTDGMKMAKAGELITALKANGWRRPLDAAVS